MRANIWTRLLGICYLSVTQQYVGLVYLLDYYIKKYWMMAIY